jgi:hypothetical protein
MIWGTLECGHMHFFGVCVVIVYQIVEYKYNDWWSFGISGGATGIGSLIGREHLTGRAGRWSPPFSIIMLDLCNEFYINCCYSVMIIGNCS